MLLYSGVMLSRILSEGGISLERLGSFREVAESGSISAAARGSASRQSLLSRQIAELEAFFGVALLNRESRPHRLTAEGEELARLCREFFGGLEDSSARWARGSTAVTLAAGESLLQWVVLPLLKARRPLLCNERVCLSLRNLRTADAIRSVVEGKVDIALARRDAVPDGLHRMGEFPLVYRLVVPDALASTRPRKADIEWLAKLPLVMMEGDGELSRAIREEAALRGISLDVRLECSSFPQVAEAIWTMELAGFLPLFAPLIKRTQAFEIPEIARLSRTLTLAWSPRKERSKPVITKVVQALL